VTNHSNTFELFLDIVSDCQCLCCGAVLLYTACMQAILTKRMVTESMQQIRKRVRAALRKHCTPQSMYLHGKCHSCCTHHTIATATAVH
jgi:hypothetical protein